MAVGTLLGAPAAVVAAKPAGKGKHAERACSKPHAVGYVVAGTLVAMTADDPATPASEASVTLKLTRANRHARRSGDIVDQDATRPGVQPRGFVYTVPAGDAFRLRLIGYTGADTPSVGDRTRVVGRIPLTKARCAPEGTSVADRYGTVDVRRVAIFDRDPD